MRTNVQGPALRSSNIELLRIFVMLLIVAHHYFMNSWVWDTFDYAAPNAKMIFLHLFGMWGKMGINVFVLITGYFMCEKSLTLRRYLKLLLEIWFYSITAYCALVVAGIEPWSIRRFISSAFLLKLLTSPNGGFTSAFMWMYLLIPFMNVFVLSARKKDLGLLCLVLLSLFSICGTIFDANVFHHVFWYVSVYFIGAYIRRFPCQWMSNKSICTWGLIFMVACACSSVLVIDHLCFAKGAKIHYPYRFVQDSNKIFAIGVAIFLFLVFRNMQIRLNRSINFIASTTFGVLLIHTATRGLRDWLWKQTVDVGAHYRSLPLCPFILYSMLAVFAVFAVCSLIDAVRIVCLEKPFFGFLKRLDERREIG